jgi:hypothetical protein
MTGPASSTLEFEPDTRYVVTVGPGSGALTSGSYVVLMSGPDRFRIAEVLDVPRADPRDIFGL